MKRFYLLTIALFLSFITQAQLVSTYVGTGTKGTSTSGTSRLNTNLDLPWGSAIDSKGNIWITNEGGHEIKMLEPGGNVHIRSGAYGSASFLNASGVTARFNNPRGIAIGPGDTLYIADYTNCAIRKMTPFVNLSNAQAISVLAGKYITGSTSYTPQPGFADGGPTVAQFSGPTDVAVDNNGNVYVADADNHAIRKITRAGVVTTIAGGPTLKGYVDGAVGVAKFYLPTGLFLDTNGDLYVADQGNQKIRKISGGQVTTVVSNLYMPVDLIYTNNIFYITDQYRIRKYANSTLSTFAGSNTLNDYGNVNAYGPNARFNYLRSLFLNSNDGFIYVADQDNHLIKRVGICTITSPSITVTGNDTLCSGDSVVLTGPAGYLKYLWSNGKTTQKITVKTAGSYTLSVTSNDSCVNTSNAFKVTVLSASSSITYNTSLAFCTGDSVVLKGPAGYTAYAWSNGAKTQNITLKTSNTVMLRVYNYFCSATSSAVTVRVKPVPTSTFTSKDSVCLNANLMVNYTGSAASTASYTWLWGGGQVMSGTGKGPYAIKWVTTGQKQISVQVTDTNGCQSVLSQKSITVLPLPTSSFTVQTPRCALSFDTITYTGNGTNKDSYIWTFDTATIAKGTGMGPYEVYWPKAGTKSVTLIVTDIYGCSSTKSTKSVIINKTPTSTFKAKQSVLSGVNDTITYTGDGGTAAVYIWNFDNPSTYIGSGKGPYYVVWNTTGTKKVTLTVFEKGCSSNDSLKIMVNQAGAKPVADFLANVTTINVGQSVNFTDNSANNPTIWKWTFTGGSPSTSSTANQTVIYNTAGTYDVKLVAQNSFGKDSITKTGYIKVNPLGSKPVANFIASATTITQGGTVTFTDISSNTPNAWKWTFQSGSPASSIGASQIVQYNNTGTFNVKLVASNSYGSDSITKNAYITVNPAGQKPVANFSASATTIIQGGSITFTDISANSPTVWKWTFQSGSPASSIGSSQIVQYNTTGTFNVKLVASNSYGSDSITKNAYITVNPAGQKPVANYTASSTTIIKGGTVTFTDISTNTPTSWKWTFQSGSPASSIGASQIVQYNNTGTFNVKLVVTNSYGSDSMIRNAYINVGPVGIEDENQEHLIKIYPSPVKDKLNIESAFEFKISSIEVLDITGRIRYTSKYFVQGTLISLDITILPKGLYLLKISGQGINYTRKISKE